MQNITLDHLMLILSGRNNINYPAVLSASRLTAGQQTHYERVVVWAGTDVKQASLDFQDYLKSQGFIIQNNGAGSKMGFLNDTQHNCLGVIVDYFGSDNTLIAVAHGDPEKVAEIKAWLEKTHPEIGSIIHTATHFDDHGKRVALDRTYLERETSKRAYQAFYPWLTIPLEEYFDAFMTAPEPILVLFGPPGGGKSTFIRSLITHRNYNAYLAYNKDVVIRPQLMRQFMASTTTNILAYEDVDNYIGDREDGNELMSSLLNASEGVVQRVGKKIIFSTNLPTIDKIDPALLRVGRCFDILKFDRLTAEQALAARLAAGKTSREFDPNVKHALAEALSDSNGAIQTINRFASGVGFK